MSRNDKSDRLQGLLDLVARSIDEVGLSGADLADRGHLSRFHFDRLVKAASGEAPSAFRRRLLLERAAYELHYRSRLVTEVAFDAGYGSPEAFARAFQRGFGVSPSAFKRLRSVGPLHIKSSNGVHFHPPGGLRLPPEQRGETMDVLIGMLEHDLWLIGEILERAERLDTSQLDRPISEGDDDTLRAVLTHLVWQKEMWSAAIEGVDAPDGAPATIAELRDRLALVAPRFLDFTSSALHDGRADETFIDATCEPPHVFTYGGMIAHVLTFSAYRRTLALNALSTAGVNDLGFGDPMGFLAEHS